MKTSIGFAVALALSLTSAALAQSNTRTTQTKVGLGRNGVQVTRTHSQTYEPQESRRDWRDRQDRRGRAMRMRRRRQDADDVRVIVNGERVRFEGQGPILENDHVLVPLRGVLERIGATLVWERENNRVVAMRNGQRVVVPLDGSDARVDGHPVPLDQPAELVNGRALVPLRFLSESLGAQVGWNAAEMTVTVTSG